MDQQNSFLGSEIQPDYTPSGDEKTLALLSHILTLVAPVLAPLIIYLIKKDESKFVAYHARESLNFQITMFLAFIVSFILIFVIIGIFLLWALGIISLILVIIATIRASEGKLYKYPISLRLIQ